MSNTFTHRKTRTDEVTHLDHGQDFFATTACGQSMSWPARVTQTRSQVTCKNCRRYLKAATR